MQFLDCGNPKCKSRVQANIAVTSVGRKSYCTIKCLNAVNKQQKVYRIVRVPS